MKIRSHHVMLVMIGLILGYMVFIFQRAQTDSQAHSAPVAIPPIGRLASDAALPSSGADVPSIWVETQVLDIGLVANDQPDCTAANGLFPLGDSLPHSAVSAAWSRPSAASCSTASTTRGSRRVPDWPRTCASASSHGHASL